MTNRFYIGKKDQADLDGTLEEWICHRIPPPPSGQKCESDDCSELADSHLYQIKGEHVCYTFVCWDCCEANASEDYLANQEYPVTEGGYAVTPRHCA
jgi:hypothetical protein